METTINSKSKRDIKRKLAVLNYAKETGSVMKACRHFGISKTILTKEKVECKCLCKLYLLLLILPSSLLLFSFGLSICHPWRVFLLNKLH